MKRRHTLLTILLVCLLAFACTAAAFAAPVVYKDSKTGVSFVVPDGWSQKSMPSVGGKDDVTFVPDEDAYLKVILFGSKDLYDELSDADKAKMTRESYSDNAMTPEDIKELFDSGYITCEVDEVTIAGVHWFRMKATSASTLNPSLIVRIISYIHLENGIMYLFQFIGDIKNSGTVQVSILSSFRRSGEPAAILADESTTQQQTSTTDAHNEMTTVEITTPERDPFLGAMASGMWTMFKFLLVGGIIVAVILLVKKMKKGPEQARQANSPQNQPQSYGTAETAYYPYPQQPQTPAQPQSVETAETEQYTNMPPQAAAPPAQEPNEPATAPVAQFCMHCGNRLAEHAVFCPVCGKKVEKLQ